MPIFKIPFSEGGQIAVESFTSKIVPRKLKNITENYFDSPFMPNGRINSEATFKDDQLGAADFFPALDRVVQFQLNINELQSRKLLRTSRKLFKTRATVVWTQVSSQVQCDRVFFGSSTDLRHKIKLKNYRLQAPAEHRRSPPFHQLRGYF